MLYTIKNYWTHRESPWGTTGTEMIEFNKNDYDSINEYCLKKISIGLHLRGIKIVLNF